MEEVIRMNEYSDHSLDALVMVRGHFRLECSVCIMHKYRFLDSWLGNGLLLARGEFWHRNRKMLTPAFHFKVICRCRFHPRGLRNNK